MGVLAGRKFTFPENRVVEKSRPEKQKESFMNYLTARSLENYRTFLEAESLPKATTVEENGSFMSSVVTRFLENYRTFFEAADLHFEKLTKRMAARSKNAITF